MDSFSTGHCLQKESVTKPKYIILGKPRKRHFPELSLKLKLRTPNVYLMSTQFMAAAIFTLSKSPLYANPSIQSMSFQRRTSHSTSATKYVRWLRQNMWCSGLCSGCHTAPCKCTGAYCPLFNTQMVKYPCCPNWNDDDRAMVSYLRDPSCHTPGCLICQHLCTAGAAGVYLIFVPNRL